MPIPTGTFYLPKPTGIGKHCCSSFVSADVCGRQARIPQHQHKDDACHSRAYEEGAEQRNAKDLDIIFGNQRLLLTLLFICIRLVATSATPSASTVLYFMALCEQRHCVRKRMQQMLVLHP